MKKILSLLSSLFFSLAFVSAHADDDYGYGMMDGMYHMMSGSYGYGGMFFGWIFGLLVVVALILLIFWLIKQIQKK